MHLVLVEDQVESLYPFSVLHCSWELRCSRSRFFERWIDLLQPSSLELRGRTLHLQSFRERFPLNISSSPSNVDQRCLIVLASLVPTTQLSTILGSQHSRDTVFYQDDEVVAVCCSVNHDIFSMVLPSATPTELKELTSSCLRVDIQAQRVINLWDCLDSVSHTIHDDFAGLSLLERNSARADGLLLVGDAPVYVGRDVFLCPGTVLDARKGAIIIDDAVEVMAHSVIMGPASIGAHCIVKAGAKIYPSTVIGEWSKVGGEIENSIIHAFTNKQHEGFLGHSFLSEWVNLGADTNTSDLKNTYGNISVSRRSVVEDTNRMFLGLLCGDHTKSGINTMFNTGTVCGIHANIFGAGYTPSELPSFTWGGLSEHRQYPLRKALSVGKTVMARRSKTMSIAEEALMTEEFEKLYPSR